MAVDNKNGLVMQSLQQQLLRRTLASARYLVFFAVPPVLWAVFVAPPGALRAVITLLSGLVGYNCWRLDLDARYFVLVRQDNNVLAGKALFFIWRRERLRRLSFTERQHGALKQFHYALAIVAILWAIWLLALIR
ncbi:TPA: hypothetical protein QFV83_000466 [Klebsiella aerogenes]|uniref:hypothetical protein n=1 Tax=Klebsiella aerogenes TaxID=548 RepID=UPI0027F46DD9|nr:hypothetical protein [Klebsiella aerogenes]MEB5698709.1 hypothetical protein [Klebsiella aerogenes]HDT6507191.1 hypothetical protein [Klebsiella aerogenes]